MYNIDNLLTTNHGVSNSRLINNYADYANADFARCNKFIDTFSASLLTPFASFLPFYISNLKTKAN